MTSINTNLPALQAQNALEDAKAAQEKAMERLSTGKKINRAGDDAAGLFEPLGSPWMSFALGIQIVGSRLGHT